MQFNVNLYVAYCLYVFDKNEKGGFFCIKFTIYFSLWAHVNGKRI